MKLNRLFDLYESEMRKRTIFHRIVRYAIRLIINLYDLLLCNYRYYCVSKKIPNNNVDADYVVSLTSFPGRIDGLWRVVETLINQKGVESIYTINLYLAKSQFKNGISDLPKKMRNQIERGLNVHFVDEDLRAHKKYYYAFQQFPNVPVITVDDDLIYKDNILSELIEGHKRFPELIVSQRSRQIMKGRSYKDWPLIYSKNVVLDNVLTTNGGGTLFPPHSYNESIFNKDVFKEICYLADDIWISMFCRLFNSKIYYIGNNVECVDIITSQSESLRSINNNQTRNANDIQIENVSNWCIDRFGVNYYLESI